MLPSSSVTLLVAPTALLPLPPIGTVALVRTLAEALDVIDPGGQPAQLASVARAQIAAVRLLRGEASDRDDHSLDDLLAALVDTTQPGPPNDG